MAVWSAGSYEVRTGCAREPDGPGFNGTVAAMLAKRAIEAAQARPRPWAM